MLSRRSFFAGLGAAVAAPAVVAASGLMPLRGIVMPVAPVSMRQLTEYVPDQPIDRLDVLFGPHYVQPKWLIQIGDTISFGDMTFKVTDTYPVL